MLTSSLIWITALLSTNGTPGSSSDLGVRQLERFDATGAQVATQNGSSAASTSSNAGAPGPSGAAWQFADPVGIPDSVALASSTDESWAVETLNAERLQRFLTSGNGTPAWEDDYLLDDPVQLEVASAEDVSLAVVLLQRAGDVVARGYTGASSTPAWTYAFDPGLDQYNRYAVDVSPDGSTVLAVAFENVTPMSILVSLDPATGAELARRGFGTFVASLELSADGSRAVVTAGATLHVVETGGLTTLFSFAVSGSGGDARISADGSTVAAGGFNVRAYRDTGSGYALAFSQQDASQWYGQGIALSADGSTLFAGSTTYTTSQTVTFRIVDLVLGQELARTSRTGSGSLQDSVRRAEASSDGQIFAVGTWGTEFGSHPEVLVFDRGANEIASLDTPGSVFDLDLSTDGRHVLAGSKAVHANDLGSGGHVSLLELDLPTFYCTPKTSSAGCVTTLATSALAQPVSGANDYSVSANQVQGLKAGIFFFGLTGPAAVPFSGGTLCIQPPLGRTPLLFSGGASAVSCDGQFARIVNDGVSPTDPGPGNSVWIQAWYRDPQNGAGSLGTALSDAVALTY